MRRTRIRGAVIQMDCVRGNVSENVAKALAFAVSAAADGVELIVLPEMFNTGYGFPETDEELAETIPGPTTEQCRRLSEESGAMFVAAILERAGDQFYDTAIICRPRKSLRTYRKLHLWKGESARWKRGRRLLPPVYFAGVRVGVLICHDLRYPEAARSLALDGAQVLVYPSAFGAPRFYSWDNQTRARAMENGVFAMFANRTGQDGEIKFGGHSRILDPFGKPLVDLAEDVEGYATADMDIALMERARSEAPQLPQVRPHAYLYLRRRAKRSAGKKRPSGASVD
jgi:predicted amidohydrolase